MANESIAAQKQMTVMLGHPVAENPIDLMFDAVYSQHGLNWQFWKCEVASEEKLGAALAGIKALGFAGACITVPYKVAAIPHLDEVDADVRAIGAVNWMTIKNGCLIGHNNDGKGVVKAIQKVTPIAGKRVAMLGAGGAGRAMAVELAWAGAAHMTIITRREVQGVEVADVVNRASGVSAEWLPWSGEVAIPDGTDILLNATDLGCAPRFEFVPVDWRSVPAKITVVDVITNPRLTPFLQKARNKGCAIVDGVEMLVQLAIQIFKGWTGIKPSEREFQQAVAGALGERARSRLQSA
jgi:shikimate dehydrogenase